MKISKHLRNSIVFILCLIVILSAVVLAVLKLNKNEIVFPKHRVPTVKDYVNVLFEGGVKTELKAYTSKEESIADMKLAYQDDKAELYVNGATGNFAVITKNNNEKYLSAPYDLAASSAAEEIKNEMASVIKLEYSDKDMNVYHMNSFNDAVKDGQIVVYQMEKGFAVTYTLGKDSSFTNLPQIFKAETFEKDVLSKTDAKVANRLKTFYKKFSLSTINSDLQADYLEKYPELEKYDLYVLSSVSDKIKRELFEHIINSGFSIEDMKKNNKNFNVENENVITANFSVTVECTLENGELVVNVPTDYIVYDTDNFYLSDITVLEYFYAAKNSDDGYTFLPDGSGSLIDFNKGRESGGIKLNLKLYGVDNAEGYSDYSQTLLPTMLPVFAQKNGNNSYFCIIEENSAAATLNTVSGIAEHNYNSTWVTYAYSASAQSVYSNNSNDFDILNVDYNVITGNLKQRYFFLGENKGYSEMAEIYREYLIKNGTLKKSEEKSELPLYINTLGATDVNEKFLVFPVNKLDALTSFEDNISILKDMKKAGIKNVNLRLEGWANGGLKNTSFYNVNVLGELGGKKGLKTLSDYCDKNGFGLYPDINITYLSNMKAFDGFSIKSDVSKKLDKKYAVFYPIDLGANLGNKEIENLVLSPKYIDETYDSFSKKYDKLTSGLSLGTLGSDLHSDFSNTKPVNRSQSLEISSSIFKKASKDYEIMTNAGNVYAWLGSKHIVNCPTRSNAYVCEKYSVPFVQMILHGTNISYAGDPINLSGYSKVNVLKAIESGSGLYYTVAYNNSSSLLKSSIRDYFCVDYKQLKKDIVDSYSYVSSVLNQVQDAQMCSHEYVTDNLVKVGYSNNVNIYINYSDKDAVVDGVVVPALDCVVDKQ